MGIFGRNIDQVYAARAATELLRPPAKPPVAITSPWSPQDSLVTFAIDDALAGLLKDRDGLRLTPETAMRIPGMARAHGIVCAQLAEVPFFEMNDDARTPSQPRWLTTSDSGVSPYHRMYGAASDWFWYGWACFGFTDDMQDCLHIPFGLWEIGDDGYVECDSTAVPDAYKARMIAVPLGYHENGLLSNAADTIQQARNIEAAYQRRLDNPIPLTDLEVSDERWDSWNKEERVAFRELWNEGRRKNSTSMHPASVKVTIPGAAATDLYETGRNGSRIDIANHTGLPVSVLEGVRQGGGGGGTEMRYTGVANGGGRSELWDFGLAKRMLLAFEARMSLDDVCPSGLSIRGDLTAKQAIPAPDTTPTSED